MRLAILFTVLCVINAGVTRAQDDAQEMPTLFNGMIGVVCSATMVDIDEKQTVELEIPLPDQQRTKTIQYTEPVPNGQTRTKSIRYWTYAVKTRAIPFADLVAYQLDGTRIDAAIARKRLRNNTRVLLGFLPDENTRSVLREDTIVLIPRKGVRIKDFRSFPY